MEFLCDIKATEKETHILVIMPVKAPYIPNH